ncbi:MAG: hypothetical protein QM752_06100 [Gammaproteobacteria bacterium]
MSFKPVVSLIVLSISLVGCSMFIRSTPPQSTDRLTQNCQNIKQDILMAPTANVLHQDGYTPAKDVQLYQAYQENNCDRLLADYGTAPIKPTK